MVKVLRMWLSAQPEDHLYQLPTSESLHGLRDWTWLGMSREWRKDRQTHRKNWIRWPGPSNGETKGCPKLTMFILYCWADKQGYCIQMTQWSRFRYSPSIGSASTGEPIFNMQGEVMMDIFSAHCQHLHLEPQVRLCHPSASPGEGFATLV